MKRQTFLPDEYRPAEDEPFMNDRQLEYFRRKLVAWKQELLDQSAETLEVLQDSARNVPDIADRASEETDRSIELRTRDRQRKLVSKIDAALRRIDTLLARQNIPRSERRALLAELRGTQDAAAHVMPRADDDWTAIARSLIQTLT